LAEMDSVDGEDGYGIWSLGFLYRRRRASLLVRVEDLSSCMTTLVSRYLVNGTSQYSSGGAPSGSLELIGVQYIESDLGESKNSQ